LSSVSYTGATQGTIQVWEQVLRAENAKAASFAEMCTWTLQYILLNQLHYTGSFKLYCEGGLYQCCNQNEVLPKEIKEYTLDYILGSIICLQTW